MRRMRGLYVVIALLGGNVARADFDPRGRHPAPTATIAPKQATPRSPKAEYDRATALANQGRTADAIAAMSEALSFATESGDQALAKQARSQMIILWAKQGELAEKVPPLAMLFHRDPPDIESGRLLALAEIRLGRPEDAERTLSRLARLLPDDTEVDLALERVFVAEGKFKEAIRLLEGLAKNDQRGAAALYARMSDYAARMFLGEDEEAYAQRAVEAAPEDPALHERLGDIYLRSGEPTLAARELRAAISKGATSSTAAFKLESLLRAQHEDGDAEQVLRHLLEGDDEAAFAEAVARMGRGNDGDSHALANLLALVAAHKARGIYLHLLLETIERVAAPALRTVSIGEQSDTSTQLAQLARRAERPLLRALEGTAHEQEVALSVLSFGTGKEVAHALLRFAQSGSDVRLRAQAVRAAAPIVGASSRDALLALVLPADRTTYAGDEVVDVATWALGRLPLGTTEKDLLRISKEGPPRARAAAMLALAETHPAAVAPRLEEAEGEPQLLGALVSLVERADYAPSLLRTAAAPGADALARQVALAGLATIPLNEGGVRREAAELFAAAVLLPAGPPTAEHRGTFARLGAVGLSHLIHGERGAGPQNRTRQPPRSTREALDAFVEEVAQRPADLKALTASSEGARPWQQALTRGGADRSRALALLDDGEQGLARLFDPKAERSVTSPGGLTEKLTPELIAIVQSHDYSSAVIASRLLTASSDEAATRFVTERLLGAEPEVVTQLLRSIRQWPATRDILPISRHLGPDEPWVVRAAAAEALGRIGSSHAETEGVLANAALADPSPLVRAAALDALQTFAAGAARGIASKLVHTDPEPCVRHAAAELLLRP